MHLNEVELPSNRKFGFFFTVVFLIATLYFAINASLTATYGFAALSALFLVITLTKADILLPLNKMWMRLGLLIGMIVSPVVLGLIFFVLFTPIAIAMRIFGRDELRLRFQRRNSHWRKREEPTQTNSFKHQF